MTKQHSRPTVLVRSAVMLGILLALGLLSYGHGAWTKSALAQVTIPVPVATATATVDPSTGGQVTSTDGAVSVSIPGGAITTTATLTYTEWTGVSQPTGPTFKVLGKVFTLDLKDAAGNPIRTFAVPVTLTVTYNDDDWMNDPDVLTEEDLTLTFYDTALNRWVELYPCPAPYTARCSQDTVNNRLTVVITHLTEFAVMGRVTFTVYWPLVVKERPFPAPGALDSQPPYRRLPYEP